MPRVVLLFLAAFWVTMNVLLWRAEYGGRGRLGGQIAPSLVWEKILTAPDDSLLRVSHHGQVVGSCRWMATVVEAAATADTGATAEEVEGMVRRVTGYRVDLEGNLVIDDSTSRLRLSAHVGFSADRRWQDFSLRVIWRPVTVECRLAASDGVLRVRYTDATDEWEKEFSREDLAQPERLLATLPGGPGSALLFLGLLGNLGSPSLAPADLALGLRWEVWQDWVTVGHSQVRAYRLQTRVLDRYDAVLQVNRVGEILRLELPDDIRLVSEVLESL